jgi:hypothetical protein
MIEMALFGRAELERPSLNVQANYMAIAIHTSAAFRVRYNCKGIGSQLTSVDYTTNPIWFRSVANGAVDQAMVRLGSYGVCSCMCLDLQLVQEPALHVCSCLFVCGSGYDGI